MRELKKILCAVSIVFTAVVAVFPMSDTITVGYRQEYLAPDNAFSLQFDSLLRDWRSPEGSPVNYDKNVKVRISLTINGQKYQTALTLLDGEQKYAIAQGIRFELLAVEPRPLAEISDYKITLAVRDSEDVGQYLVDGKFEEAGKVIDEWLKEPKDWVIPANVHVSAYVLEKLVEWLEYHLAVSAAQLLCLDCIETYPAQSEIIVSYSNQGVYDYKVLDVVSDLPMRTAGFHDFDGTGLLLLQVDYITNRFEAVKDLFFQEQSDGFSVISDYESPGDFGSQRLYYEELEQLFFYGTIFWMVCGEIMYPKNWNIPYEYPLTVQSDIVIPKNGFERVGVEEGWQPPSEEAASAWVSVMPLVLAREFIATNPEEKVKVYFYTPSVGDGDPRDWKWIFILRNQFPQLLNNQEMPTAIANTSGAEVECKLYWNVPNPFREATVIRYTLPQTCNSAQVVISNIAGQVVLQIPLSTSVGTDKLTIEGGALSAGIYYYSLYVDGRMVDTKRMILTK